MVLVVACTLAQVDLGTFGAVNAYIRSFLVWCRLPEPRPPSPSSRGGLIGLLLTANLAAAQLKRLERSRRKIGISTWKSAVTNSRRRADEAAWTQMPILRRLLSSRFNCAAARLAVSSRPISPPPGKMGWRSSSGEATPHEEAADVSVDGAERAEVDLRQRAGHHQHHQKNQAHNGELERGERVQGAGDQRQWRR